MKQAKKLFFITLAITFTLTLFSCSTKNQSTAEARFSTLQTQLNSITSSPQQLSAKNDDITVTLHHMIVEPNQLILNYTISGSDENLVQSIGCSPFITNKSSFDSSNPTTIGIASSMEKNGTTMLMHNIVVCQYDSKIFSQNDVGSDISLRFSSCNGKMSALYIDGTITDIYTPNTINICQELPYNGGSLTVLGLTQHSCYTEITADLDVSLNEFIFPQLYDANGNQLNILAGNSMDYSSFWYMPIPQDSDRLQLEVAQAQKDGSYKVLSDRIAVTFP